MHGETGNGWCQWDDFYPTLSTFLFLILSRLSESVWQQIPLKTYQRHHPPLHPPTEAAKWVGCKQDSGGGGWLSVLF